MSYYLKSAQHQELERLAGTVKAIPTLIEDEARNSQLWIEHDGIVWDASRQRVDGAVLNRLLALAEDCELNKKIQDMFTGKKINLTENRSVLHTALRSAEDGKPLVVEGQNVTADVHNVLKRIKAFSNAVRNGDKKGHTGKPLVDTICIGIGGSYLGGEFVFEALKTHKESASQAKGRRLHFLANVDPIDIARALEGFDPETTLVIIVSKTFTTAETILNAKSVKNWILKHFNGDQSAIEKHVCAVSTNLPETKKFGISDDNVFGFWDWVGGRFSVCSAVGVLPLAIQYGYGAVEEFLRGARSIDKHFSEERNMAKNIPIMMGLTQFWNSTYLKYKSIAVLPYCQALCRFPAHIQQLTMESNGKQTRIDGTELVNGGSGEVYFGEPGTNGQHSFYQLIHQGQIVPCEFIGFSKSQTPYEIEDHSVSNHHELMSNFFAQPDALAYGKSAETLKKEGVPEHLVSHKTFNGDRPSSSILFLDCLTPYRAGQLLSLYEHRTAVQGFLWGVNSFDQWGVELGKVLAKRVRQVFAGHGGADSDLNDLPKPTQLLISKYLNNA